MPDDTASDTPFARPSVDPSAGPSADLSDHLIDVAEMAALGGDPRALRRAAGRGGYVRVRRGVYVPRGVWEGASSAQRHSLVAVAASRAAETEHLVAGRSAAALWRMPYAADEAQQVTLLVPYRGGGQSEPGVRRTSAGWTGPSGIALAGVPVTSRARTALDVAAALDFGDAVALVDWVRSRRRAHPVAVEELEQVLAGTRYRRGGAHLRRVVDFSTSLSDSVGESRGRVAIHLLGFAEPELQARFVDAQGEIFPDYTWREAGVAGEFDGKVKYTRAEFTGGDPSGVVWREKLREDRLRRLIPRVVRLTNDDLLHPDRLRHLLLEAGVPRRRSLSDPRDPRRPGSLGSERDL